MENVFLILVEFSTMIIYFIALFIILIGALKSLVALVDPTDKSAGMIIGESLDLALRYLMVSEVLHTFTADSLESLINLGLLLVIRIAIVVFNQKEMEHESQLFDAQMLECECDGACSEEAEENN